MLGLSMAAVLVAGPFAQAASAPQTVSSSRYLKRSAHAGTLRNRHVVFSGRRITVPVVAVAPGAPDTTFEVHGRVNPTLVIPAGAKVRFDLANADKGMVHGLDVTRKTPPYAANPGLPERKVAPGAAHGADRLVVTTGVVPHAGRRSWHVKRSAWVTLAPGTYYYMCPIPGHAKEGMHGRIVVKATETGNGVQQPQVAMVENP